MQAQTQISSSPEDFLKTILADVLRLEKHGVIVYLVLDIELKENLPAKDETATEFVEEIDGKLYCTKFSYSIYKHDGKTRVFIDLKRFEHVTEACEDSTIMELIRKAVKEVRA